MPQKIRVYDFKHFSSIPPKEILRRVEFSADFSFINNECKVIPHAEPYWPQRAVNPEDLERNISFNEKLWDGRPTLLMASEYGLVQVLDEKKLYETFSTDIVRGKFIKIVGQDPFDIRFSNRKGFIVFTSDYLESKPEYGLITRTKLIVKPNNVLKI